LFYEDAFVDTTFLGRRLVDSPESRVAGVFHLNMRGTRSDQLVSYQLHDELSLGNKVHRNVLWLNWRDKRALDWQFDLSPRLEFRRDQTFDRDLDEWRGRIDGRVRHMVGDPWTFAELKGAGEFVRTSGTGSTFLLDRQAAYGGLGFDHAPLFGSEWHLGYRMAARSFPDSADRNHLEHGIEARWRKDFLGGHWLQIEADGYKRLTQHDARTSRDNFLETESTLEGTVRWGDVSSWRTRLTLETLDYDREDSTLYFDYRVGRLQTGPRIQLDRWTFTLGPRIELLSSPRNPVEQYHEYAGSIEVELMGRDGSWWSLTPVVGRRNYEELVTDDPIDAVAVHSSYTFYELGLIADQPIGGGVRLRLFGSGRLEQHVDSAQDARSLYFSIDVRRLF
jgi:hypothetical protein